MKLLSHLVGTGSTQIKGLAAATDANDAVRLAQVESLIQALEDQILGGASSAYDTFLELQELLTDEENGLTALLTAIGGKVAKDGDTMTGALTLPGAPTQDLHASTKKYVDDSVATGGSGIT